VTDAPNGPWFTSLPPCETLVPCGQGRHAVRWEAGDFRLLSHADPEAELVLAALGGDKARCVEIAEVWRRHTADLTVLGIGPRGPADEVTVSWDDVDAAGQASWGGGGPGPGGGEAGQPAVAAMARAAIRRRQYSRRPGRPASAGWTCCRCSRWGRRSSPADRAGGRGACGPAGRAGPARIQHPSRADGRAGQPARAGGRGVARHRPGPGGRVAVRRRRWGSVELTGRGGQRRLRVSLPADWVARVWASGLALTGRHLVVAVERAGWRDAQVLALRAPGAEPVSLSAHVAGHPSRCRRCRHTGRYERAESGGRGTRGRGRGPGAGAALGCAGHRQDVRYPRDGGGHGAALRDG